MANVSRKSTISKSPFEVHVSGIETPRSMLNGGHRNSRHMVEFDEYFVRLSSFFLILREERERRREGEEC